MKKILFITNTYDEFLAEKRGVYTDSPAANQKVQSIVNALNTRHIQTSILSIAAGRSKKKFVFDYSTHTPKALYCAYLNLPMLRHLVSMISLCLNAITIMRAQKINKVLVYNTLPHYIPAILIIKLMFRIEIYIDIEDNHQENFDKRASTLLKSLCNSILLRLCSSGAICITSATYNNIHQRNKLLLRGIFENAQNEEITVRESNPSFLFSGTLEKQTGAQILLDALTKLQNQETKKHKKITIHVTGFGSLTDKFKNFRTRTKSVEFYFHGRMGNEQYTNLLKNCDVGLSLKLPNGPYAQTTFPSKLFEYASYKLAIISTKLEDVECVFGQNILYANTADELINAFDKIMNNKILNKLKSKSFNTAKKHHDLIQVGKRLEAFFYEN